jgi:DNA-binding NtrC family response regulator
MVVAAENMLQLLNTSRRVAPSKITVLIVGETGTGKELLARALHDASPRKDKPFIPFNCSGCASDMLDSQLFGYRRGAFTGAQEPFPGVIRAAAGGTLFLDEIGEITLDVQPKLLRFLESSEIHPLGEPRPVVVDVRVVAATNANLEQLVAEGKFREDLFYRLNVVRLEVPPLRERREEIPQLVQHYLDRGSREMHKTGLRFAEETMEYLILYKWPGNVRQLANEVKRLVAFAESGAVLMPEHLSNEIASSRRTIPASERDLAPTEFVVRTDQPLAAAIEHVERTLIQNAFKRTGSLEEAAQLLGLSRKGLYLKRQRLGLDIGEPEPALAPVRSR